MAEVKTPRTDRDAFKIVMITGDHCEVISANIAREIERELETLWKKYRRQQSILESLLSHFDEELNEEVAVTCSECGRDSGETVTLLESLTRGPEYCSGVCRDASAL